MPKYKPATVDVLNNNLNKTVLPFAVYSNDTNDALRIETEKSAIFCLSELGRNKGSGFLKKKPPEKTVFLAKMYYPFWFASYTNLNVILDGLNISSHSIIHPLIPDINTFRKGLKERFATYRVFSTFLSDNLGYFHEPTGEKTINIDGLIVDLEFVRDFINYLKEATTQTQVNDGVLLSPANNEKGIVKKIKYLTDSHNQLKMTLEQQSEIIKILNTKKQFFIATLNDEIRAIDRKYTGQIKKATLNSEREKTKIDKTYSKKIAEITEEFEEENVATNKDVIHLEKTINKINADIAQLDVEIKNAIISKDEQAEGKLKEKRSDLKKQLPELLQKSKKLKTKVQVLEEGKKNQLFLTRQEKQAELEEASRHLLEIEAARDAEKKNCQDEMEKIEDYTTKIVSDIDKLCKMIEETLFTFTTIGIKGAGISPLLVHMPFYLFCYTTQSEKRFSYAEPSKVNTIDISIKLKTLGRKKLTQLFQPRSLKTASILNRFIDLVNENVAFKHEIIEAACKANLLKSSEDKALIQNGLNILKQDGWISKDEFEAFGQTLTQI